MRSTTIIIAAASISMEAYALQASFRIRTPQHLQSNDFVTVYPSVVQETPATESPGASLNGNNLSPFLQELVDEQRELQMNVGKAMDVLKHDYPDFLKRNPDYSIYSDDITLTSPSTPTLTQSLSSYRKAISLSRYMLNLMYDADKSIIQNRMVYDSTRCQIRVSFNAQLVPRNVLARRVYLDGISVYNIDMAPIMKDGVRREDGGKIVEHKIEKMLVNGLGMKPPYLSLFGLEGMQSGGVLAGAGAWS